MGILILFVLAVGAGTIVYFVWKFVAKEFKAESIRQDMAEATRTASDVAAADAANRFTHPAYTMDGKARFWDGSWWLNGMKMF
ncbi:MAG: hypothetical protein AWT59_2620 [Candidatus Gallionella acididurans]|uniref:Uncharacterized protein n=1 Tax=Candidatus Gallionella acididurans TaxID=1796491 RepID=A0A139BQL7_9PROT|nr:MAG: hypothetical protein AWT59_2620 [Candidatus Gallionella acididurans]